MKSGIKEVDDLTAALAPHVAKAQGTSRRTVIHTQTTYSILSSTLLYFTAYVPCNLIAELTPFCLLFPIAMHEFSESLQTTIFSIYHPFASLIRALFLTLSVSLILILSLLHTLTLALSLLLTLTSPIPFPLPSPGIFNSKGLSMSLNGLQGLDSKIPDARLLINSLACLIEKSDVSNSM